MTDKEAIKYLQQLYPNGGHCWLDEQRIEAISMAIKALQEEPQVKESAKTQHVNGTCEKNSNSLTQEPVSEELEEASFDYAEACKYDGGEKLLCVEHFRAGAQWKKAHNWKPADGDDLPEIDREVIALLDNGKVVFAHRPPEYWDGKDIITGKVARNYPKTYDKGGWNIPNVKYWLDIELPKEIEL